MDKNLQILGGLYCKGATNLSAIRIIHKHYFKSPEVCFSVSSTFGETYTVGSWLATREANGILYINLQIITRLFVLLKGATNLSAIRIIHKHYFKSPEVMFQCIEYLRGNLHSRLMAHNQKGEWKKTYK
jgi:hypothetical protein